MNIFTKIFLDGADPEESKKAKEILGFLDGQTTNPTLLAKNPEVKKRIEDGKKFSEKELHSFYKKVVTEISEVTPGPISIQVYVDKFTKSKEMLKEAEEIAGWISNACVKFPITKEGLEAANLAAGEGIPVNLTLCFSQEQAAAVYATIKERRVPVFVSSFVGRLDDQEENGMNLIENISQMYDNGDGHVTALAASIRSLDHLLFAIKISCPAISIPFKVIKEWADKNLILPDQNFNYNPNFSSVPYQEISLEKNWLDYNIKHDLTDIGIEKFSSDWKLIIK